MTDGSLTVRGLAQTVGQILPDTSAFVKGTVNAVDPTTSTATIQFEGSSVPVVGVPYVDSCFPIVGNNVWLAKLGDTYLIIGTSDTDVWHVVGAGGQPAFQNSWVNFGGSEETAQFKRVGDKVFMRGLLKSGTPASVAYTLPAAYAPTYNVRWAAPFQAATGGFGIGILQVNTSGQVIPTYFVAGFSGVATTFEAGGYFNLGA